MSAAWAWSLDDQSRNRTCLFQLDCDGLRAYFQQAEGVVLLTAIQERNTVLKLQQAELAFNKVVEGFQIPTELRPDKENLPVPFSWTAPVVRAAFVTIAEPRTDKCTVVPFGDALIETSPFYGFGIYSIFRQATILKESLETVGSGIALIARLSSYAEELFNGTLIQHELARG
ncbi:MAG: hypothetical protein AAGB01_09435 [Cyanobacteria bacterium P01_F01_bin.42]